MSQSLFVSNRNITVRTTLGHSVTFLKGKPTHVPPAIRALVVEKGILPCDERGTPLPEKGEEVVAQAEQAARPKMAPESAEERAAAVLVVVEALVKRNDPKDFTGGGTPNAEAVSAALGWKVDQKEVRAIWTKERPRLLGAEE